jgi:hypothetical protein
MRYIGSKTATLPAIQTIIAAHAPKATSLCDPFAGTCTVARHFKGLGLRVETGDLLWGSYIFQLATMALNQPPTFTRLLSMLGLDRCGDAKRPVVLAVETVLSWLTSIPGTAGYVTDNFSDVGTSDRRFFTRESATRIDAIRERIADWRDQELIDEMEQAYLLACLLDAADRVANTAGTYMAHLKSWTRKALRPLELRPLQVVDNGVQNRCSRADARRLRTSTFCISIRPTIRATTPSTITYPRVSFCGTVRRLQARAVSLPSGAIRSRIFAFEREPRRPSMSFSTAREQNSSSSTTRPKGSSVTMRLWTYLDLGGRSDTRIYRSALTDQKLAGTKPRLTTASIGAA